MNIVDKYFQLMEIYFPFIDSTLIGLALICVSIAILSIPFSFLSNFLNKTLLLFFQILALIVIIVIIGVTIYILSY